MQRLTADGRPRTAEKSSRRWSAVCGPLSRRLLCLLLTLLGGWSSAAQAQDTTGAFATMTVGAMGTASLNETVLRDGWSAPRGGEGFVEMPFYAGVVRGGTQVLSYERRRDDLPRFWSVFLSLGWRLPVEGPAGIRLTPGFRLGIFQMLFDGERVGGEAQREQEVRADLVLGLDRALVGRWRLHASVSYGAVLLSRPIDPGYVSVGISRTITTPGWLREALQ